MYERIQEVEIGLCREYRCVEKVAVGVCDEEEAEQETRVRGPLCTEHGGG
jgi:hypothetical protein